MKNLKKLVLTGIAGIFAASSFGQLTISGEIKPRAEYRHGFKSVADSNQAGAFSIDQRTRINVGYIVDDYEFYVSMQDVRTWGATQQLNLNDPFLSVHQAWAKVNFNKNHGLKLGRQEIKYDDDRMFGNVDWAQQARSHDAAVYQFKNEKTKLDLGVAFNQMGASLAGTDYTLSNSYRDMQYLWFNHGFSDKVTFSFLALNVGQQVFFTDADGDDFSSMKYILSLGTHTKFDFGKFKMNFNGYYQMGSVPTTPLKKNSAYLIGLDASYAVSKEFTAGLGYELQSGTTQTDTTKAYSDVAHNFNPIFGTNHKFNGYMDYFYVGSGHGNVGLQDIYLKLKYAKEKWTLGLDVHIFMAGLGVEVYDGVRYNIALANAVTPAEITAVQDAQYTDYTLGSMLGTELDLSFSYKIKPTVMLKAGYSHMLASETLASLKGTTYTSGADAGLGRTDQINNWGYVMIIFKPIFLTK